MFETVSFPQKSQAGKSIAFFFWYFFKTLYYLFIWSYGVIGVYECYKIIQTRSEGEIWFIMLCLFIILYVCLWSIFVFLIVFFKPLKPLKRNIVFENDRITIDKNTILFSEIKGIKTVGTWWNSENIIIYTWLHNSFSCPSGSIIWIWDFFKRNFPDANKYLENAKEEEIQSLLKKEAGGEHSKIRNILNSDLSFLIWILPLSGILAPTLNYSFLFYISLLLIIYVFFILKFRLYQLSFLHKSFWSCCLLILAFYLIHSRSIHFLPQDIGLIFKTTGVAVLILLTTLIKGKTLKWYWFALWSLICLVILLSCNMIWKFIYEPYRNTITIISKESNYSHWTGSYYTIKGKGTDLGVIENDISTQLGDKLIVWDTITVKTYQWLLGINFYEY